jgi:hypothetical protein
VKLPKTASTDTRTRNQRNADRLLRFLGTALVTASVFELWGWMGLVLAFGILLCIAGWHPWEKLDV